MTSRSATTAMLLSLPHMTVSARIQVVVVVFARLVRIIVWGPVPATDLWRGGRRPVSPPRMYPPFFLLDTLEKGAMIREQAQAPLRT